MEITTIKIHTETKTALDRLREHPAETYDAVIRKALLLVRYSEKEPQASKKVLATIRETRRRTAQTTDAATVKRRLGVESRELMEDKTFLQSYRRAKDQVNRRDFVNWNEL